MPSIPTDASSYTFEAIEVKETSFRTDGVWMPPTTTGTALNMMVLTTLEGDAAIDAAKAALAQGIGNRDIIEMVTTIMVYKFTQLTRAEVDSMLGTTLQETRIYQDALAEGRTEGKLEMISMLLSQRFGDLPESMTDRLAQLEALGTQILSFTQLTDVTAWLDQ